MLIGQGTGYGGGSLPVYANAVFTVPGTYSWTAPSTTSFVTVVAIGGGGGGGQSKGGAGGGLGWKNNILVTPGSSYTVVVGAGGAGGANSDGTQGSNSYFISNTTVMGIGGAPGTSAGITPAGGGYVGDGGGYGGNGGIYESSGSGQGGGGGGAGGYTGSGGRGGNEHGSNVAPTLPGAGAGGGGGGGGTTYNDTNGNGNYTSGGGGGGGVGIYGVSTSGANGVTIAQGTGTGIASGGGGGSGGNPGETGSGIIFSPASGRRLGGNGGLFGGGGGGNNNGTGAGGSPTWVSASGANGAVAIFWGAGSLGSASGPSSLTASPTYATGWFKTIYNGYYNDSISFLETPSNIGNTNWIEATYSVDTTSLDNFNYAGTYSNFSIQWMGYFKPAVTDVYTFILTSDDSSNMWIGPTAFTGISSFSGSGSPFINNSGPHGSTSVNNSIILTAGVYYPVRIAYGQSGGGLVFNFTYQTNSNPYANTNLTGLIFYNSLTNGL